MSLVCKPGHSEGPLVSPDGYVVWRHNYTMDGDGAYPMPDDFQAPTCSLVALPPELTPDWMSRVFESQFPKCWGTCTTTHFPYNSFGVRAVKVHMHLTDSDIKEDGLPNERGYSRFCGAVQREMGPYAGYLLRRVDHTVFSGVPDPDNESTSYQAAKLVARVFVFPPGTSQADVEAAVREEESQYPLDSLNTPLYGGRGDDSVFWPPPGPDPLVTAAYGDGFGVGDVFTIHNGTRELAVIPENPVIMLNGEQVATIDEAIERATPGEPATIWLYPYGTQGELNRLQHEHKLHSKGVPIPAELGGAFCYRYTDLTTGYGTVENDEPEDSAENNATLSACFAMLTKYRNRCESLLDIGLSGLPRTDEVDELIERVRRVVGE